MKAARRSRSIDPAGLDSMTIGQLAHAAGVPTTTLRYYERAGLLEPGSRSGSGYRLYGPEAVERLSFIRAARAVGFALEDIGALMKLDAGRGDLCQTEVAALIEKRLAETEARLEDLKRVRAHLSSALSRCRSSHGECAVMQELGSKQKRRNR
jgi:DNA-binding transcriptional MerR regulator